MKNKRINLLLILCFSLIFFITSFDCAYAAEENGSLNIILTYERQAIDGAEFSVYQVAKWNEKESRHTVKAPFRWNGDFVNIKTADDQLKLSLYFEKQSRNIKEMMKGETGDDGTAKFTDLKDGIYLVVQTGSSGKAKDFGSNDKEKGYYKALQEAIWYYSDSIDGLKSYSSGSVGYHIMKKAVKHIIQESEKVSDEDMECVKLKMYNSSMLGDHNSPLQPLIAFEIINKTDIKVQKVNKSGESLEGAAFRLEKLGDASFTPVEMGNESAISDFTFKCLDAGEYRLTEIKAPSNYIPLEEPILFTIIEESNGVFKIKLNTENSKVTLEEGTLTIKVANEKTVTTEITVDKKWFRADGTEFHPQDGEISYNLIQVLTTEGGESSEKIYKSGETLTSQDGWQKTYSNLPTADINGNGEKEICTYYVKEILIADYSTSYSNGSVGESEDPSAAALSSGTITVKNTEKMKFILPETGGTGRGILYIAGVFLLGISMILLGNKNSSFYECLHKKG